MSIDRDVFLGSSLINLKPRVRILDELVVKPKGKKSYILLSGYYRSYQTKESKLEYFSEGNIEIIVEDEGSKSFNRRIEERTWHDYQIKPQNNIIINMVGPPIPELNYFGEGKTTVITIDSNSNINLAKGKNLLLVEIPKISPSNPKTIKLLGNESVIGYENEVYAFQTSAIENLLPQYLNYYKKIKELRFKCKGCYEFQNYHLESELFITGVKFIDSKPKNFSKFTGFIEDGHYERAFWKDIENHPIFEPLPKFIDDFLEKVKE